MDNKQKPEDEQPEQLVSSEGNGQGESISNEAGDLPPEHPAPNETSGIGELIQDGVKLIQGGVKRVTENLGIGSQQQIKPEKLETIRYNLQNVYNLLCRFEKGNERSLTQEKLIMYATT